MLLVGLTGGIGSGKSTVAAMLEARGAVALDADRFARRALDPGTPGHARVLEAFGPSVLAPSGGIDRAALAAIVFEDPDARQRLEQITHPEVARRFLEAVGRHRGTDSVVVYDVPLLVESGLEPMFDAVVAVRADPEMRVRRLVARGMSEADVRARIAAQATDEDRARVATLWIDNDGSLRALESAVDELWQQLRRRSISSGAL